MNYEARIREVLMELGNGSLPDVGNMPLQEEATDLVSVENDMFDRPQYLVPGAAAAWTAMRTTALEDGIILELVSAFRSVEYQAGLIRNKLERGQSLSQILAVNAAPGYSEHHTGRAVDLST
ncbi:MAG: D-alanyl-D-alanine carboxypeptidase family protein, partial [Pseudomonadales bacterium]|nr:D-alanyl-D-alanine carboxypeptidase family protein [Pseudomonadales bacterium]